MRIVVLLSPGPSWIAGPITGQNRSAVKAHLSAMAKLYADGLLVFSGHSSSDDRGLSMFEADTLAHVREIMDEDPAVSLGIIAYDAFEIDASFDALTSKA